jgi:hypothetical protein
MREQKRERLKLEADGISTKGNKVFPSVAGI